MILRFDSSTLAAAVIVFGSYWGDYGVVESRLQTSPGAKTVTDFFGNSYDVVADETCGRYSAGQEFSAVAELADDPNDNPILSGAALLFAPRGASYNGFCPDLAPYVPAPS